MRADTTAPSLSTVAVTSDDLSTMSLSEPAIEADANKARVDAVKVSPADDGNQASSGEPGAAVQSPKALDGSTAGVSPTPTDPISSSDTSAEEAEVVPQVPTPEATEELSEDTKAAIVKQVEFYFSDENLPTDTFMKTKMKAGGAQGWVPLKAISRFPKMKKLSKDARRISLALEASDKLVVSGSRVRRKTPYSFPDKDGMADVTARTVLAVNIPRDATAESLMPLFSKCGVAESIRIVRNGGSSNNGSKSKEIQPPVQRDFYAVCQYSNLDEAIRAVNELTDRNSWRGGRRVMLANGVTVEKALAKVKAAAAKKARQEQKVAAAAAAAAAGGGGAVESASPAQDGQRKRMNSRSPTARNSREGQSRSRSLTELELEAQAGGGVAGGRASRPPVQRDSDGSGGDGSDAPPSVGRKARSVSNVDALFSGEEISPPRHNTHHGDALPRKGVVQTVSAEGWAWIKRDGNGSRKGGNRIPFSLADVVSKDGDEQPLQKGDHVEYHTWRDDEGKLVAVRVERVKEKPRTNGTASSAPRRAERSTQAHFRMALGPEEGNPGFAVGRGRRLRGSSIGGPDAREFVPAALGGRQDARRPRVSSLGNNESAGGVQQPSATAAVGASSGAQEAVRRPRGGSMGGPDSKVFVPEAFAPSQFEDAN